MKQVVLLILDGWGEGEKTLANPLTMANLPTLREIECFYPKILLNASGISVGLLWGEPGNSEAGHLNLGAGQIIYQYLPRIIIAIRNGSFFRNPAFIKAASHVKKNNSRLHVMGLFSSGSVHAYSDHLYAMLDFAKREGVSERTFVHIFTDGRDAPPKESKKMVSDLEKKIKQDGLGRIGSIMGRKYSMNRNDEWELTQAAYELLTQGKGEKIESATEHIMVSYKNGLTDEYIKPAIVEGVGGLTPSRGSDPLKIPYIQDNDTVIFFNYREDSARQLTKAFVLDDFSEFPRKKLKNLFFVTMTEYEKGLPNVEIAFRPVKIIKPLTKVISNAGLRQLHIAETEKYAHVTYFFNGMKEKAFAGEDRILVPSHKVSSFAEVPEMKTYDIAAKVVKALKLKRYAFILANFASADMVGHTGNFEAGIKAAEAVDKAMKEIKDAALERNAILVVSSDHGNIEEMRDINTGEEKTEHTINPVPLYLIGKEYRHCGGLTPAKGNQPPAGILADVAPTILEILGLEKPDAMTGESLLALLK